MDGTVSAEQTSEFIQSSLKSFAESNGFTTAIVYRNRIAGCIGLHYMDWGNKQTTIGYWLAEEYQGKGIMTNAVRALVNYVFHELALNRVEIRAAERNSKSRAIPERLRFVNEGTARQAEWLYDHYVDLVIYGMVREEWATS